MTVPTHPTVTQAIEIIMRQHACAAHTVAKILNARAVRSHTPMQTLAAQVVADAAAAAGVAVAPAADRPPATDLARAISIIMEESACDARAAGAEILARAANHGLTADEVATAVVQLKGAGLGAEAGRPARLLGEPA